MLRRKFALTLLELLAVMAVLGLLVALLLPLKRSSREAARRNSCSNNLKQIALAILGYENANGTLPPAYTVDAEGNRLHSWRTLILPYMERQRLFDSIDLSKPWDDPINAKAREIVVGPYVCPSATHEDCLTTYLGVSGPECVFSGSDPRKLSEITDGPANTGLVIDVHSSQAVHWMSPKDVGIDELLALGPERRSHHPGTMVLAFLDGHVQSVSTEVEQKVFRSMLTISGGEKLSD